MQAMGKYSSYSDDELLRRAKELRNLAEGVAGTDIATDPFNTPLCAQRLIVAELSETRPIIEELLQRGYGDRSSTHGH